MCDSSAGDPIGVVRPATVHPGAGAPFAPPWLNSSDNLINLELEQQTLGTDPENRKRTASSEGVQPVDETSTGGAESIDGTSNLSEGATPNESKESEDRDGWKSSEEPELKRRKLDEPSKRVSTSSSNADNPRQVEDQRPRNRSR